MKYLLLFLLAACSKSVTPPEPPPIVKYDTVRILLLVAPWCEPCNHELPIYNEKMKVENKEKIQVLGLTQTGTSVLSDPDEISATYMQTKHGVYFDVVPDEKRWYSYKKYFPNEAKILPATVLLGIIEECNGNVCLIKEEIVKTFNAHITPDEIIHTAKSSLK